MKKLIFILILALLSACAAEVSSLQEDKDKPLQQNSGYLLLSIDTSYDVKAIHISGPKDIVITHKELKEGTNFVLTDLPEGTYTMEKVELDRYWQATFKDQELWQFDITKQSINYVGHLELSRTYWFIGTNAELVNRSSEALEFMEQKYPSILGQRDLFYGGPGEDNFFSLLKSLEEQTND